MKTFRLVPADHKITITKGKPLENVPWIPRLPGDPATDPKTRGFPRRSVRSVSNEKLGQDTQYQEFAGKFIKYNIINLQEI